MQLRFSTHALFLTSTILIVAIPTYAQEPEPTDAGKEDVAEPSESEEIIDVRVQGQKFRPPFSLREPTAASTVLSQEKLLSPGQSTADILLHAPGVQVSRAGAGSDFATASIRGASSAQTPVFLAGIPLNDDVAGTADLSTIPPWMLDRIEVYRGHAPEFTGQLGIGGAVLFEPKLPQKSSVGFGQSLGSYGEMSSWIAGTLRNQNSMSLVALRRSSADNNYAFTDDGGTRFDSSDDSRRKRKNADFRSYDGWAIARQSLSREGDVTVVVNAIDREQGVTGLAIIPAQQVRARARRVLAGVTGKVPCASSADGEESPCKLMLSTGVVIASHEIRDPVGEMGLPSLLVTDAARLIQQVRMAYRIDDRVEVSVQGSQASENLSVSPSDELGLHASRHTSRLGASVTAGLLPTVTAHGIVGAECHTTKGGESSATCGIFEPFGRLGARWAPASWLSFFGNLGRYLRPPTLGELYGTSPVVRGTPSLVSEKGTSVDLGIRATRKGHRLGDLSAYVEAFAFRRWVSELVAYQRTSFGVIRPFNVGTATVSGLEFASGGEWLNHFANESTLTLLDPRDTTPGRVLDNDLLPFQSRLVFSNRFEAFVDPTVPSLWWERTSLGVRVHRASSRYADPAGLIVIGARTTVDLELSAQFWEKSVAGRFALRNLFNGSHFDTVGYPLPGRSYHANVEAWF